MDRDQHIQIYQWTDGSLQVEVQVDEETIWLSQKQMSELFWTSVPNILMHIQHIWEGRELEKEATIKNFLIVQKEGKRDVSRNIDFYNLDMIISVWYRVNSQKATQFRVRATNILKQHIIHGYTLNHERLMHTWVDEVTKSLALIRRALSVGQLSTDETRWLAELMTMYIPSLITLNKYDTDSLPVSWEMRHEYYRLETKEARSILEQLKKEMIQKGEATDLFALEREMGVESIFWALYQTYDSRDLYPTVEEKAAQLLYLVIKNHPFIDGNKRSWAFLFVRYLAKNDCLSLGTGEKKINEQTLVALALLVATSKPEEKELLIRLIIALLYNK